IRRAPAQTPLLVLAAGHHQTLGVRLQADDAVVLGRRDDDQLGRRHWRGDEAQVAAVAVLRVEVADAPDFAAILEAVGDGVVIAVRDEVSILSLAPDNRRGVGVLVFGAAVAFARHLPDFLAG